MSLTRRTILKMIVGAPAAPLVAGPVGTAIAELVKPAPVTFEDNCSTLRYNGTNQVIGPRCAHTFKDSRCGYRGLQTRCNKLASSCACLPNFGGFPDWVS